MKLFSSTMAFGFALALSCLAGIISIKGMMALFAADGILIAIMIGFLEGSKLVAAGWIHGNWRNPNVSVLQKGYLVAAIIALMLITSIGIYGYLAQGFLEQQTPLGTISVQISQKEQQILVDQQNIHALNDRQTQLDKAVDILLGQNQVSRSQNIRAQQKKERDQIAIDLTKKQQEIEKLSNELVPLKISTNDVEAKLGPIKYVAQLFGWTKPDVAVRMVILVIMFAFDPLAIVLILSGSISFNEWLMDKKTKKETQPIKQEPKTTHYKSISKKLNTNLQIEVMPITCDTDKETVMQILQRNPDSIEDVVDTIIEWHDKHGGK